MENKDMETIKEHGIKIAVIERDISNLETRFISIEESLEKNNERLTKSIEEMAKSSASTNESITRLTILMENQEKYQKEQDRRMDKQDVRMDKHDERVEKMTHQIFQSNNIFTEMFNSTIGKVITFLFILITILLGVKLSGTDIAKLIGF